MSWKIAVFVYTGICHWTEIYMYVSWCVCVCVTIIIHWSCNPIFGVRKSEPLKALAVVINVGYSKYHTKVTITTLRPVFWIWRIRTNALGATFTLSPWCPDLSTQLYICSELWDPPHGLGCPGHSTLQNTACSVYEDWSTVGCIISQLAVFFKSQWMKNGLINHLENKVPFLRKEFSLVRDNLFASYCGNRI